MTGFKFTASTEGDSKIKLADVLQSYADAQWIADHMTNEEASDWMLDRFRRQVESELKLLTLKADHAYT